MKKNFISDYFENKGLILISQEESKIENLKYENLVEDFEVYGLLVFRGFDLEADNLTKVTDLFTQTYANDAPRRVSLQGQKHVNVVDTGFYSEEGVEIEMPLHSEASYSPSWPEILWFYCAEPSEKEGESTLCDGVKLWKRLSFETKNFFLSNPICFNLEIPILTKKPGKGKRPWMLNSQGASDGYIDWDTGNFYVNQIRFAVNETRQSEVLSFSNHLMSIIGPEETLTPDPQITKWSMLNGEPIPEKIMEEVKFKSSEITYDHKWQKADLIMLDNKRFMHGRRSYNKKNKRKIINIQTLRANFGYGSTTRSKINSSN